MVKSLHHLADVPSAMVQVYGEQLAHSMRCNVDRETQSLGGTFEIAIHGLPCPVTCRIGTVRKSVQCTSLPQNIRLQCLADVDTFPLAGLLLGHGAPLFPYLRRSQGAAVTKTQPSFQRYPQDKSVSRH